MDHNTFDALTRRFARAASRRAVFSVGLALLSPFVFSPPAKARQASSGAFMGETCLSADDCAQMQGCNVSGPVLCADNGTSGNGALACCLAEDGFCGSSEHCCGDRRCIFIPEQGTCAGRCRPTDELEADVAESITQRLLSTPLPEELLYWEWGVSDPYLNDDLAKADGLYAEVEIDTGRSPGMTRVGASYISYHIYLVPWQAEEAYEAWRVSQPEWLSDNLELDGEPFISPALLRGAPDPQFWVSTCGTVVSNILVFATLVSGNDVEPYSQYDDTVGNCRVAVSHLQSLMS